VFLAANSDAEPPERRAWSSPGQWIVLVARNQRDLFTHLTRAFASDEQVEVILDRRRSERRNPPGTEDRLRTHGAAIIRRLSAEP